MADAWPDLKAVRTFLRLQPDATEDGVIDQARQAAVDYGNWRTNYQWAPDQLPWSTYFPDRYYFACLQHASRLYKRRDSIDGTVWLGEMAARVGKTDPDIEAAYNAGPMVFG